MSQGTTPATKTSQLADVAVAELRNDADGRFCPVPERVRPRQAGYRRPVVLRHRLRHRLETQTVVTVPPADRQSTPRPSFLEGEGRTTNESPRAPYGRPHQPSKLMSQGVTEIVREDSAHTEERLDAEAAAEPVDEIAHGIDVEDVRKRRRNSCGSTSRTLGLLARRLSSIGKTREACVVCDGLSRSRGGTAHHLFRSDDSDADRHGRPRRVAVSSDREEMPQVSHSRLGECRADSGAWCC